MTVRGHLHERCPDQARGASGGIKVLQKYILFIYIIRFDSGPRHSGAAAGAHTPDKAAAVCRSPHGACGLRPLSRERRRKMEVALFVAGVSAGMVLQRVLTKTIYSHPWTICANCEYRNKHEIPCLQKRKKLSPMENSFKD